MALLLCKLIELMPAKVPWDKYALRELKPIMYLYGKYGVATFGMW